MQSDQRFFAQNPVFPLSNQVDDSYMLSTRESAFGGTILPTGLKHSGPLHGVEFQPSEVCPKNFIIFDQTHNRSQIMFHPAIAPKLCYPGLNIHSSYAHNNVEQEESTEKENHSSLRENSDDIDALLDSEDYEQGDEDESKLPPSQKSSGGSSCNSERKRQKMRKTVKVLRGIVPGGSNRMNTAAVLDEAVRYLKSLKVEAQKLGVANLNN
ncbi:hypothetical protein Vadar_002973 [Vaccinium darrowii]|uniref:Uncharacterized protein n=1 Tax=Vaccinium darrowii TaxID=229202 RepID=A0ACB7XF47_9ERIC|nr:hypothetical protein Vadar_002973 [Vaccinium darrowii]